MNYLRWLRMGCALFLAGAATVSSVTAEDLIVERGPHHNLVQTVVTNEVEGVLTVTTNQYVDLGSGKNYWDPQAGEGGQWVQSTDEIEILETGAVYRKGPYQLRFAANINDPNGNLEWFPTPEKRIVVQTIGVAVVDGVSGDAVWLGQIKDTQGFLTARNEVTYLACFEGIDADLRIRVGPSGFENDVILKENLPNLQALNFQEPRIEIWHHIISGPEPVLNPVGFERAPGKLEVDAQLEFDHMRIGSGTAFLIGTNKAALSAEAGDRVRVSKEYFVEPGAGSRFLIESVPLAEAQPHLNTLPASRQARVFQARDREQLQAARREDGKRRRPMALLDRPATEPKARIVAFAKKEMPAANGFLMDFTTLTTTPNHTFKGDTTYVVASNTVVQLSGHTILEGGSVIKFGGYNPNGTPLINITGTFDCQTRPYAPAVFTSREDRTVGETNTAQLTNIVAALPYGAIQFCIDTNNANAIELHDIRSRYASNAFGFYGTGAVEAWNIQVVSAYGAAFEKRGGTANLRNVLVHGANNVAVPVANNTAFIGEHFTIHTASKTFSAASYTGCAFNLTNSILAVVTNTSSSGVATAFSATHASDTGVFQSVGGGAHYLADNSPNRNVGTPVISERLATHVFKYSTTYPPIAITANLSADTVLRPQALRDRDTPDRGYHYPAADWAIGGISLASSKTLTLTNGVAVLFYGTTSLTLGGGSKFISEGRPGPMLMNKMARYNTVHEQPVNWGTAGDCMMLDPSSPASQVNLRLTEITHLADINTRRYYALASAVPPDAFSMRDCEVYNSSLNLNQVYASGPSVSLINNLFHRSETTLANSAPMTVDLKNNLFRSGNLSLAYADTYYSWTARNNLFDNCAISATGSAVVNSYNGYVTTSPMSGASNTKTVTTANYQTGPLGPWYYPTSGANTLFILLDGGTGTPASLELFHYTTLVDQTKDTPNVDIGYHYVAVDANGFPSDGDGDGVADYLEDRNGNGAVTSGESPLTYPVNNVSGLILFTPLQP